MSDAETLLALGVETAREAAALVVDGARKRLMAVSADGAVQLSDAVTP